MSIVFYSAPHSSAAPVGCALAELEVPHAKVSFDLKRRDHKQPDYLAINPNGTVPALVVDGAPMFEGLAILTWLGDRFGVAKGLWPACDDPKRLQAMSWCTWAYVTYGPALVRLQYAIGMRGDFAHSALAEHSREQLYDLLGLLETRLSGQPYLLGSEFSLADLVVASVVGYSLYFELSLERYPHLSGWVESFQKRRSYQSVMQEAA